MTPPPDPPQSASTLSGSVAPSWPASARSSRCGLPSRSTTRAAPASCTASASKCIFKHSPHVETEGGGARRRGHRVCPSVCWAALGGVGAAVLCVRSCGYTAPNCCGLFCDCSCPRPSPPLLLFVASLLSCLGVQCVWGWGCRGMGVCAPAAAQSWAAQGQVGCGVSETTCRGTRAAACQPVCIGGWCGGSMGARRCNIPPAELRGKSLLPPAGGRTA